MRDLFLDFAETFLVSAGLSRGEGSDLNFLEGLGPKLLILSAASLLFRDRAVSPLDWWPRRSSMDVLAASCSSCNANEAMESVRPLLSRKITHRQKSALCLNEMSHLIYMSLTILKDEAGELKHAHETAKRGKGYLLELCPLDWPVAELAVALEALELDLLLSGGEFALCFTCSDCNLQNSQGNDTVRDF